MDKQDLDIRVESVDLKSPDIIDFMKEIFKQDGPFARELRDKIIRPLVDKISKKTEVDPIIIENKEFKKQTDKELKKIASEATDKIHDNLIKSITDLSQDNTKDNLFELLGFSKDNSNIQNEYKDLQKKILGRLTISGNKLTDPLNLTFDSTRNPLGPKINNQAIISLHSLFGLDYIEANTIKNRWKTLVNQLLSKFKIPDLNIKNDFEKGEDKGDAISEDKGTIASKGYKSMIDENITKVSIADISDEGKKDLSELLKKLNISGEQKIKIEQEQKPPSWLEKLAWAGLGLVGGGLYLGINSIFDDGPFKGLKKLIGNLGARVGGRILETISGKFTNFISKFGDDTVKAITSIGDDVAKVATKGTENVITKGTSKIAGLLKTAAGKVGNALGKVLKILPFIGTLISFGSAVSRLKEGQYMQGMIDIASGLANLLPGAGWTLSIGLDALNALIDYVGAESTEGKLIKTGGSSIIKVLTATMAKYMKNAGKFLKTAKALPLIGTLLSFGSAVDRFKKDEIGQGILDIASGIASIFPGLGTAISIGLDALNMLIDFNASEDPNIVRKREAFYDWISPVTNWIYEKVEKIKYLPGIDMIYGLMESIGMISAGDVKGGLLNLWKVIPGSGMIAGLIDWLDAPLNPENPNETIGTKVYDFFGKIKDWIVEKFKKTPIYLIGDGLGMIVGGQFKEGLKSLAKGSAAMIPSLGYLISWLESPDEETGETKMQTVINFGNLIRDWAKDKFIKMYNSAPRWMQWIMDRIPGVEDMIQTSNDEFEITNKDKQDRAKEIRDKIKYEQELIDATKDDEFSKRKMANDRIAKLEEELETLKKPEEKQAQDFISRPGQPVQKFSSEDMVIGIKPNQPLYELIQLLKDDTQNKQMADLIKTIKNKKDPVINIDQASVVKQLENVANILINILDYTKKSNNTAPNPITKNIPPSTGGYIRDAINDPIYNYRNRVWAGGIV